MTGIGVQSPSKVPLSLFPALHSAFLLFPLAAVYITGFFADRAIVPFVGTILRSIVPIVGTILAQMVPRSCHNCVTICVPNLGANRLTIAAFPPDLPLSEKHPSR